MRLKNRQKFSDKHSDDTQVDNTAREKILELEKNGEVPCAVAFKIVNELKAFPAEIGKAVDLLDLRLVKCQLGLFGYRPQKKIVKPKQPENSELEAAIRRALVDGDLSCRDAWDIAGKFSVSKMSVSAACEAMNIKIKPCQLGAF